MWNFPRQVFPFLLIVLLLSFSSASALSVRALTDEELTRNAEVILVGKVLSAYSDIDREDHGLYTYISIRVDEYLKGKHRPRNLMLKTVGGVRGEVMSSVPGAADFYRNEEVMLFLARRSDGSLFPIGLFLGKYSIYRDVQTDRKVLVRAADGHGQYFSEPREDLIEGLETDQKLFLDDFRQRVQRILEK